MSKFSVMTKIQVRFCDFDVLGHLNNAIFSTYIELARVHFMQDILGLDLTQITGVVANYNIDYKRPVKFGTQIVVLSRAESDASGRIVNMTFEFVNAKDLNKVYAVATQRMVAVDPQTSQLANLPKRIQRDLELLMAGELKHPDVVEQVVEEEVEVGRAG